jgi:hypothetical protein
MISIVDRKRRLGLQLSVRVQGADEGGRAFVEETRTCNISAGGICFESGHHLPVGGRVSLDIAIPEPMRRHFGGRAHYAVGAVVCRVERFEESARSRVGARFVVRN